VEDRVNQSFDKRKQEGGEEERALCGHKNLDVVPFQGSEYLKTTVDDLSVL
jgi:hypothetical protein